MSVHHDLPPEIVVRDLPDGVRYELPRRHWGVWRWFGWMCALVSVISVVGLSFIIAHLARTFGQSPSFFVGYILLAIVLIVVGIIALYCALSALCSWGIIEARETSIMRREYAGPFHRTHRRKIDDVERLSVASDSQAKDFDPATRRRLGNMAYTLAATHDRGTPFRIARWYPLELLRPLAHDMARRVGELRAHHFSRALPIEVRIDSDEASGEGATMDMTPVSPPRKSDIAIERERDTVTIIVPPMRLIGGPGQSLTGLAMNGLAAAAVGLFVFSWIFGGFGSVISWIVLMLAIPAMGSWMVFLGERLGERETYVDIVDDVLLISSKSIRGVRVREWSRDEITDVKCGESMIEIDDNALPQLQIITTEGQTHAYFTGRNRDELRWLSYQIRSALVGEPSDDAPTEPAPDEDEGKTAGERESEQSTVAPCSDETKEHDGVVRTDDHGHDASGDQATPAWPR